MEQSSNNVLYGIVFFHPDLFAISALHRACVWLGEFQKQRDTMARVLPHWKEDMALYPFIISM